VNPYSIAICSFPGTPYLSNNVICRNTCSEQLREPVEEINVTAINSAVVAPKGTTMINALEFEPTGATFSIPIEVIIDMIPDSYQTVLIPIV
jgi:hypothetical protein